MPFQSKKANLPSPSTHGTKDAFHTRFERPKNMHRHSSTTNAQRLFFWRIGKGDAHHIPKRIKVEHKTSAFSQKTPAKKTRGKIRVKNFDKRAFIIAHLLLHENGVMKNARKKPEEQEYPRHITHVPRRFWCARFPGCILWVHTHTHKYTQIYIHTHVKCKERKPHKEDVVYMRFTFLKEKMFFAFSSRKSKFLAI